MVSEKQMLDDKIERLNTFILGDVFPGLSLDERNDMVLQLGAMRLYSHVLGIRIQRFNVVTLS